LQRDPFKNRICTFLLLVFALSWPLLIYGFGWYGAEEDVLNRYLFSCLGMLMVAVSAFITRAFFERQGFGDAGWNLGHSSWYLAALLLCASMWLGPPFFALMFGKLSWVQSLGCDEITVIILSLGGFSLLAGFGEEFGWRGYLIPRMLTERKRSREVLVLIGIVWGLWHCAVYIGPLFKAIIEGEAGWVSGLMPILFHCLQSVATSIALSFIFGAVWLKGRSILLSSFLHGYWIGLRDSASLFFSYPAIFRAVTLCVILTTWLIAYHWLQKFESQKDILWIMNKG
jgi:membrane protease YdiL (CAAX protease family)